MSEIPTYEDFMLPVLQQFAEGQTRLREVVPALQSRFDLTDEEMERLLPSGRKTYVYDRAGWACSYMFKAGLLERIERGRYRPTPAGLQLLAENPQRIDRNVLARYPAYQEWQSRADEAANGAGAAKPEDESATPEDRIEAAFRQLDHVLREELLEQVLALTPARFEQLIVDLLIAMGYGDGRAEMGEAIGRSGDGGIDGIVKGDKLGLDAVYIQAKRYAPDNTVGRPALQAFIGSMTGESAAKGVFVTTSGFSSGAREYVRLVQQRVVLIDGEQLARLMIDHGVGVVTDKTYVLRSIDANFFDPA